jgi:hypothetical protein
MMNQRVPNAPTEPVMRANVRSAMQTEGNSDKREEDTTTTKNNKKKRRKKKDVEKNRRKIGSE